MVIQEAEVNARHLHEAIQAHRKMCGDGQILLAQLYQTGEVGSNRERLFRKKNAGVHTGYLLRHLPMGCLP